MWSVWNGVDEIFSNKGIGEEKERIYIRGLGNSYLTGKSVDKGFRLTGSDIYVYGNIKSLAVYSNVINKVNEDIGQYVYCGLFAHNSSIKGGQINFNLNYGTIWYEGAVKQLFYDCPNMVYGPESIPCRQTRQETLKDIFRSCYSLEVPPAFWSPLEVRGPNAANGLFNGCTGLNAVPYLDFSYIDVSSSSAPYIFKNCSQLKFRQWADPSNGYTSDQLCITVGWCNSNVGGEAFAGTSGPYTGNLNGTSESANTNYYTLSRVVRPVNK